MSTSNITFGRNRNAAAPAATETLKKSEFWLNIGIEIEVNGKVEFISLPLGIALDTQAKLNEQSSNPDFGYRQAARNKFHADLLAYAKQSLKPGEDEILGSQIAVQVRRVKEVQTVSTDPTVNPYVIDLGFKGE